MQNMILLLIIIYSGLTSVQARVITIDPTREEVDYFPSWNLGCQDAVDGDTIFVTQAGVGTFSSNSGTLIQKGLTVVGPGYDLSRNYPLAVEFGSTGQDIRQITIRSNSPVTLYGFDVKYLSVQGNSNAKIIDCKVRNIITVLPMATVAIRGAYIQELRADSKASVNVSNSAILSLSRPGLMPATPMAIVQSFVKNGSGTSISFLNSNILESGFCNPSNSIYYSVLPSSSVCSHATNISSSGQAVIAAIPSSTNSADSLLRLAQNSPAFGTGFNGADIGMFGGSDPYILSGIPPFPWIYEIDIDPVYQAPATSTDLRVKVRAVD